LDTLDPFDILDLTSETILDPAYETAREPAYETAFDPILEPAFDNTSSSFAPFLVGSSGLEYIRLTFFSLSIVFSEIYLKTLSVSIFISGPALPCNLHYR